LKGVLKRVKKIIEYGNLLHHTHIAENNGRFVPGVNNEDFTAYFKALKKINYCDRMSRVQLEEFCRTGCSCTAGYEIATCKNLNV
jgi:sugar phosphate isomerase/epimerase